MWSVARDNGNSAGAHYASPDSSALAQHPYDFLAIFHHFDLIAFFVGCGGRAQRNPPVPLMGFPGPLQPILTDTIWQQPCYSGLQYQELPLWRVLNVCSS